MSGYTFNFVTVGGSLSSLASCALASTLAANHADMGIALIEAGPDVSENE